MPDLQVLDHSALSRLRDWGGEKLLAQMVRLFLANAPARMAQIRGGVEAQDVAESEKGAHSLKSSAANVGAAQVRALAADMERCASAGDLNRVTEMLPPLESAFAQAIQALESVERGLP